MRKTFSKILVAINESSKSPDIAVNYATKLLSDFKEFVSIE